jgi:hypothetical protein
VVTISYELPTETGEQRLQRLRDRQHVWQQRGMVLAVAAGSLLWLWYDGGFEEIVWSWNLLWLLLIPIAYLLVASAMEAMLAPFDWALSGILRRVFRPLGSRGYSYYDEEEREERENPTPDYSRAERIPEDYR